MEDLLNFHCILLAAKQSLVTSDAILIPLLTSVDHMVREHMLVSADERCDVVLIHFLKETKNNFEGKIDLNK